MRRVGIRVLQFGLAIGLIAVLVRAGLLDVGELRGIGERWPWILLAQAIFVLFLFFATLRWHLLMHARGILTPFRDTAAILLIGWLFNQTMPSSTGGDVAKAVAIALEHPRDRASAVLSIAIDRFIGLIALLAFALATAAVNAPLIRSSGWLMACVGSIALLLVAVLSTVALFSSRRLRSWLAERGESLLASRRRPASGSLLERLSARALDLVRSVDLAVSAYRSRPDTLLACLALSFALHLSTVAVNLCLTYAVVGRSFDWLALVALIPIAHAGMAVPITPGALGVAETLYAKLFAIAGIAQGSAVCVLQRLIWYSWALVGAAVFVLRRRRPQMPVEPLARPVLARTADRSR